MNERASERASEPLLPAFLLPVLAQRYEAGRQQQELAGEPVQQTPWIENAASSIGPSMQPASQPAIGSLSRVLSPSLQEQTRIDGHPRLERRIFGRSMRTDYQLKNPKRNRMLFKTLDFFIPDEKIL